MDQELQEKMIERTLVIIKPDALKRSLTGEIIARFEKAGLKVVGMKMVSITKEFAKKNYPEEIIPRIGGKTLADWKEMGIKTDKDEKGVGRDAWNDLIVYITEGPVVALILEGVHAVDVVRKITGSTSPHKAQPGTIRGDYSHISMGYATHRRFGGRNLIHSSGSVEEAEMEIKLWFKKDELFKYKGVHDEHLV